MFRSLIGFVLACVLPASLALAQVPSASRAVGGPVQLCPDCGRLYWPGGHVRRMLARLAEWSVP